MGIEARYYNLSAFADSSDPYNTEFETPCSLAIGIDVEKETVLFLVARYRLHSTLDKGEMDIIFFGPRLEYNNRSKHKPHGCQKCLEEGEDSQ